MTPKELRRLSKELREYLAYCFDGMGRAERREALSSYLRGLLLDGERKSMVPLASRLASSEEEIEAVRQRLQQAIAVASWDPSELYRRVALRVEKQLPEISAFVFDDTGFPKKGKHSVGVQRQYSGTLGRVDNCQVATSIHLASELGGACIGMRLFLPEQWAEDRKRCRKAGVPEEVGHKEKWRIALDLLDDALSWGLPKRVVLADSGYGDNERFRKQLQARGLNYVVAVTGTAVVWPPDTELLPPVQEEPRRRGAPKTRWRPLEGSKPMTIKELANSLSASSYRRVRWKKHGKTKRWGRFAAVRIRTARRHASGRAPGDEQWLLCEQRRSDSHPTKFYLSDLPPETALRRLAYLAKLRWRVERDYQEMKGELGLDHFEGRGWVGFHHHLACVAAAHSFLTIQRLLSPPVD